MNELNGVFINTIFAIKGCFHLAFVRSFPDEVTHNGGEEEEEDHCDNASDNPSRRLCRRD